MWKQVVDNVWVLDNSSNTFEDTVMLKTVFSLFKVLETVGRIDCNERNSLKALRNRLIPICAVFKFTTNPRWLSSIIFKGCICHGSQDWAFFWSNLSINAVQTGVENHHSISTHVGLLQCNRQDNIHTYDTMTRQVTGSVKGITLVMAAREHTGPYQSPKDTCHAVLVCSSFLGCAWASF